MQAHKSFKISAREILPCGYFRFELSADGFELPVGIRPGQFVQLKTPGNATLLRRPISIHFVDYQKQTVALLIRDVGVGTNALCNLDKGDRMDVILPLGRGFTTDFPDGTRVVLAGGGVGVAPLLYQAKILKDKGLDVSMVYGARSREELVVADSFLDYCVTEITTDDGSTGTPGRVTDSAVFKDGLKGVDMVQCCGPAPMMKAVAAACRAAGVACEVSLENMMACGLGACLCCVEKTVKGNVCVCTEGPVFNIEQLTW